MRLQDLYETYHERVQFFSVYIREAHPTDGWWLGGGLSGRLIRFAGLRAATHIRDPRTEQERIAVAQEFAGALAYGLPTLVDSIEDHANRAYAAWPTRLYLIGVDGRVVYAGGPGPFGFKPVALGQAIERYMGAQA